MVDYSNLASELQQKADCFVFDSIPSTNDYLLALAFSNKPKICIANQQTQGKGQYHRNWVSQKDHSILLSIRRVFSSNIDLSGLSLMVGLALVETLKAYGAEGLKLKWPNDVYFKDKKLAGILIENSLQADVQSVVVGLGVNVDFNETSVSEILTPWTDLKQAMPTPINQADLVRDLINKMLQYFDQFEIDGFTQFHSKWTKLDYLLGKKASYQENSKLFAGVCIGVDQQGALLVKSKNKIKRVYSSEFLHL